MKTQITILIFVMITGFSLAQTGSITNINAAQSTDGSMMVDIYYDLAGSQSKFRVTAEASFDGGSSFATINQVSGDIGYDVATGNLKHIIWNFGSEFPGSYSSSTQIRLTAAYNCGYVLVDDRDGQTYNTVQIGEFCWMAENLNIDELPDGTHPRLCYNGQISNCDEYGGLYSWEDVMNNYFNNRLCPSGWGVPDYGDWCGMAISLDNTVECNYGGSGTDVGIKLKSTSGWNNGNNGTNESGFNALPGGHWSLDYGSTGMGEYADFWTSSWESANYFGVFSSLDIYNGIDFSYTYGTRKKSVRCIRE